MLGSSAQKIGVALLVLTSLTGCDRTSVAQKAAADRQESEKMRATNEGYRALLSDEGRAARWRRELQEWQRLKENLPQQRAEQQQKITWIYRAPPTTQLRDAEEMLRLLREGAHGPPGIVPPFLEIVEHTPHGTVVRNKGVRTFDVSLRRVMGNARPETTQRCLMSVHSTSQGSAVTMAPNETRSFNNSPLPECSSSLARLEVMVRERGEWIWATDTAMEDLLNLPADPGHSLMGRIAALSAKYRKELEEQGVSVPESEDEPSDVSDPEFRHNRQKCLLEGDPAACGASVCREAYSDRPTIESLVSCARAQKMPFGKSWALTYPLSPAGRELRGKGHCFEVVTDRQGRPQERIEIFLLAQLQPNEYRSIPFSGSSIEEVAEQACRFALASKHD